MPIGICVLCFFESFVCATFFSNKLTFLSALQRFDIAFTGMDVPNKISTHKNWDPSWMAPSDCPCWNSWWSTDSMAWGLRMFPRCRSVFLYPLDGEKRDEVVIHECCTTDHRISQIDTRSYELRISGILTVSHTCSILSQWFQLPKRPHIRIIQQPTIINILQTRFMSIHLTSILQHVWASTYNSRSWKRNVRNTLARPCRPCASHQRWPRPVRSTAG